MKNLALFTFFLTSYVCFAQCPQPDFCNRICWDVTGTHPAQTNPTPTVPSHIIVHHTGDGIVFPTDTDYAEMVRFYWDLHVNTNGWSDIGYNWLIDRSGIIYEGRGDGILGAHFSGTNLGTMGVALIGDFTLETPSVEAINSLQNLIAWEASDKDIDVLAATFHPSSGLTLNTVSGHLDGGGTECPGTDLYSLLPSIRTNVSAKPCYNGDDVNFPDLVIQSMWTIPANPITGESVDLYVEIENLGDALANNISVDYEIDANNIGSAAHPSLAPNESTIEVYPNYVFPNAASYDYCVFINPVANEQNVANNSFCVAVEVEEQLSISDYQFKNQLKVYPNPSANLVYITSENGLGIKALYVYDLNGRKVKQITGINLSKINISELTTGVYVLNIVSDENEKAVFRIIKE